MRLTKIAFDIGGTLSKYPDIFRPLINSLLYADRNTSEYGPVEVYIISDMKPHEKAVAFCHDNGFEIESKRILIADYYKYGEECKAEICKEHKIDILIDDHMGYVSIPDAPLVRLLVMPDPKKPYYHETWIPDGSEGDFGRLKK